MMEGRSSCPARRCGAMDEGVLPSANIAPIVARSTMREGFRRFFACKIGLRLISLAHMRAKTTRPD